MKKKPKIIITAAWLRKQEACDEYYKKFRKLFGDRVTVTRALLVQHSSAFDLDWLVSRLLSPEQLADYEAQVATLLAAYEAQVDPLTAAYDAQVDPLRAAYNAQLALVLADVLSLP